MRPNTLVLYTNVSNAAGEAFVRELDVSKITVRIMEKQDKKGDDDAEHVIAKLSGSTLETLQRCLVSSCLFDERQARVTDSV